MTNIACQLKFTFLPGAIEHSASISIKGFASTTEVHNGAEFFHFEIIS